MNLFILVIIILIVFLLSKNINNEYFKETKENTKKEENKQKIKIYKSNRTRCFDCEKQSVFSHPSKCFKCEKPLPKLKEINKYNFIGQFLQR